MLSVAVLRHPPARQGRYTGMSWVIARSFVQSAWGQDHVGDDIVVDSGDIVAVIDGVSYHGSAEFTWEGDPVPGGRFAALLTAEAFASAPADLAPGELAVFVSEYFRHHCEEAVGLLAPPDRPGCVYAAFNTVREEVTWVGDAQVRVEFPHRVYVPDTSKLIDDVAMGLRCAVLEAYDAAGMDWPEGQDPGRASIEPLLRVQQALGNTSGEFGFGVVNGSTIPQHLVGSCSAEGAQRVVLATDGYPTLSHATSVSWEAAEEYLAQALAMDPLCRSILAGVRGVRPGALSFDDRSWLELTKS